MSNISISTDGATLEGELVVPPGAKGLVIFAHGGGSNHKSPRNKFVAHRLQKESIATLLVDLLSPEENNSYQARFDVGLLADRLKMITNWAARNPRIKGLKLGYFGASIGAAAAMVVGNDDERIKAIVSRGGRVDMAFDAPKTLNVPVMLIIGSDDYEVMTANKEVFDELRSEKRLVTIPHATHLFEEPGVLEKVADASTSWFKEYLEE